MTFIIFFMIFVAGMMVWAVQRARKAARLRQERADFIRQYRFPAGLKYKLDQAFPELSDDHVKLILEGLRAWLLLVAGCPGRHFGMPSKAVDTAWHEFILLTQSYADFCDRAFGKFFFEVRCDVARHQCGTGLLGVERRALLVQRADMRALLVGEHRRRERAGHVVLGVFGRRAHVDDFVEIADLGDGNPVISGHCRSL